jgi:hypothetical protein
MLNRSGNACAGASSPEMPCRAAGEHKLTAACSFQRYTCIDVCYTGRNDDIYNNAVCKYVPAKDDIMLQIMFVIPIFLEIYVYSLLIFKMESYV